MKQKRYIALMLVFTVLAILFVIYLWRSGCLITDRSAEYTGEGLFWNGRVYRTAGECDYTEGRVLAKTQDGWKVSEVKEDPAHNFVVVRSFLDNRLLVAEDYKIQTEGNLSMASWNREPITDPAFLQAITQILQQKTTSFEYETDGIFILNDQQRMKALYLAYDGCPLATICAGWLGKINGQWVLTTYISNDCRNEDGSPKPYMVGCYVIPEAFHDILKCYFFE